jgi:hypothetical protein
MTEPLTSGLFDQVSHIWHDYSSFLMPALAGIAIILLVRSLAGARSGRDGRPGLAHRAIDAVTAAFIHNWQLTLLATTALVLSLASGWRTWEGMRNFTGEPIASLMVTFGIQGVMLIIAWLIGESFAAGLNQKSGEARARSTLEWAAGMGVGVLFAIAALAATGNALGLMDTNGQSTSSLWSSLAADKAIYIAAALLLVATLMINSRSDVVQPYVRSLRIMARNAVLWVMFFACAGTAVFFSFDSFFTSIFPEGERKRAAEIRAINQVAGVVADVGALTQRRQGEEAERLFQNASWVTYEKNLLELSKQSQGAERAIEDYFVQQMEGRRRGIAEQQERIASAQSGQAGLISRKATLTDELSRLKAERPALAADFAEKKTELDSRARGIDAKRVEAMAEEKGAEGTLKVGKGPQFRERIGEMSRLQDAFKIQDERVRDAQKRLTTSDTRIAQIERELAAVDGDIGKLKGEAQTAESRIQAAERTPAGEEGPKVDPARVRLSFERARSDFRQSPTVERLNALSDQCTQLLGAMSAAPATKDKVRGIDCDPKPAAEAASRVFMLNAGLDSFARHCAGGDKLPEHGTDALLSFGRKCLQDSGLPSKDSSEMAARISGIDLNRDDKAHRFVVTWNAFQDGNRLAYLALAMAIGIESLVFMSALFGANAVRSPLTDLEGRGELTADQLEGAIDSTLKTTPDPRATLAVLLRSMHPIQASDGFTSEIVLDPREPHIDDMRAVLVAGATIGAVRRAGADRGRYLVSTGLARYFAIAQRKTWPVRTQEVERKELVNVIGVALLPDPQANADIVLSALHPISDAPGFAAEAYPFKIEEPERQRLVLTMLGAGATIEGAVKRYNKDDGRYFVSTDVYKTLLLLRAAAIPAFRDAHLLPGGSGETRPLRDSPRQLANEELPRLPRDAGRVATERNEPEFSAPMSTHHSAADAAEFADEIREELVIASNLFRWNADDVAIVKSLGENSEPERALVRLLLRAPKLAKLVEKKIEHCRAQLERGYRLVRDNHHDDARYIDTLDGVASELAEHMPLLILSSGGPYQQVLRDIVVMLEQQNGDGSLSSADHATLVRVKAQLDQLNALPSNQHDRLMRVAKVLDQYDERSGSAQVAEHDEDRKRTLN